MNTISEYAIERIIFYLVPKDIFCLLKIFKLSNNKLSKVLKKKLSVAYKEIFSETLNFIKTIKIYRHRCLSFVYLYKVLRIDYEKMMEPYSSGCASEYYIKIEIVAHASNGSLIKIIPIKNKKFAQFE